MMYVQRLTVKVKQIKRKRKEPNDIRDEPKKDKSLKRMNFLYLYICISRIVICFTPVSDCEHTYKMALDATMVPMNAFFNKKQENPCKSTRKPSLPAGKAQ